LIWYLKQHHNHNISVYYCIYSFTAASNCENLIMKVCPVMMRYLTAGLMLIALSFIPATTAQSYSVTGSNSTIVTCCYIQRACDGCTYTYRVNSIAYCCPNCRGEVLVTDLRCACYVPATMFTPSMNCTVSSAVVGNYIPLRPSYYVSTAGHLSGSIVFSTFSGSLLALWSGLIWDCISCNVQNLNLLVFDINWYTVCSILCTNRLWNKSFYTIYVH